MMSEPTETNAPEPVPIRQRPIPDQLDYYSELLAPLVDWSRLRDREAMIAVGATLVGLGAIAAQLRARPLPSITDGISDAEAYASATFDLTIDEVRNLKTDRDAAIAEWRHAVGERDKAKAVCKEWSKENRLLRDRAEEAEAALAELRERIARITGTAAEGFSTDENDDSYSAGWRAAAMVLRGFEVPDA